MGEIIKHRETAITQNKDSIFIEMIESDKENMEHNKLELNRLKGIENTMNYYKSQYEHELEINKQLSTELNLLKPYKTLLDVTCLCSQLNKKINIFDCNRGFNNYCKNKECSSRRILIEDILNKYIN